MPKINKPWAGLIVAIIFLACLFALFGESTPLPGYVEEETSTEPTTVTEDVSMQSYTEPVTGLTIQIPEEWQKVNTDGSISFIHRESSSAVEISVEDYNPSVTTATAESSATATTAAGYTFNAFNWLDNCSYILTYTKNNENTQINYIRITQFDRDHIVQILYTINGEAYVKLESAVTQSIESIEWDRQNPIPSDFMLYYNEFGNFEFGSPINWSSAIQNGSYYAQDSDTGATMVITVTQSNITYENISQIDYVSIASQGRSNFALRTYSADANIIRGTAVYMYNGQQYMMMQYLLATGEYEYSITFDCPVSAYEKIATLYDEAIDLFRIF